jgi:hypothetical protein
MSGNDPTGEAGWTDLARNPPGIGITHEAARRRTTEGAGADRSWRVGADGEATVAEALATLTDPSGWERLRRRSPRWRVLHSVPVGDEHGRPGGDIDHVLVGPPGVVTINTKNHRGGRLALDGDQLVVNGRPTTYVAKARREAERAAELLRAALHGAEERVLATTLRVRPMIAIVGGRLLVTRWPSGVTLVMTRQLVPALRSMPTWLDTAEQDAVLRAGPSLHHLDAHHRDPHGRGSLRPRRNGVVRAAKRASTVTREDRADTEAPAAADPAAEILRPGWTEMGR